jgi:plasmid stability protein
VTGSPPTPDPRALHPDLGSWLNLVEVWFGIIERQAIHRGTFTSVKDLNAKIRAFINGWNDRCKHPFVWTKTADEILTKANRPTTSNTREAEVRAILSAALLPSQRVLLGDALASLGRDLEITDDDVALLGGSGRFRRTVDGLKLDRGGLAEGPLPAPTVVGPFDPGDDRQP